MLKVHTDPKPEKEVVKKESKPKKQKAFLKGSASRIDTSVAREDLMGIAKMDKVLS
jgi:hypothetical protein